MKKYVYLLLISILFIPVSVFAQTYSIEDLSIDVDDSTWYVFTRDNIQENAELDELGISYDYISNFMNTNDVYMDACLFDEDDTNNNIELFVTIKKVNNVNNLHTYSSSDINNLGKSLMDKVNSDTFDVYSVDKFKYIHVKYFDSVNNYNIDEYYTIINGYGYNILVQKINSFSNFEENYLKEIVDSTSFNVDFAYEKKSSNSSVWEKALIGAITAGIIGGLSAIFNKTKKKKEEIIENKGKNKNLGLFLDSILALHIFL